MNSSISRARPGSDGLAVGLSLLCLVHCLALPLIAAAIPALANVLELPESAHLVLLLLAVPVSAFALVRGYRHHGAMLPALFGGVGLALLAAGVFAASTEAMETGLTVAGGLLLAAAHLRNWKLRARR